MSDMFAFLTIPMLICLILPLVGIAIVMGYRYISQRRRGNPNLKWYKW